MRASVDSTAVIEAAAVVQESARIGRNCHIGSGSVVGPGVSIGDKTVIGNQVHLLNFLANFTGFRTASKLALKQSSVCLASSLHVWGHWSAGGNSE